MIPPLQQLPFSPRTIVDAGAANGIDTFRYASAFPEAQIHAFEPLGANVRTMHEALSAAPPSTRARITIHECALGDEARVADVYVSGGQPPSDWKVDPETSRGPFGWPFSSSLFAPAAHTQHWPWCTFTKVKDATIVRRLDTFDVSPDFIHADVQGAELAVLRGAGKLLDDVRGVWLEVSHVPLYADQPLADDVSAFLVQQGFRLTHRVPWFPQEDQLWLR